MSEDSIKIRTITYFASLTPSALRESAAFFKTAREKLQKAGFEVQDCRIATESRDLDVEQVKSVDQQLDQESGDSELILNLGPVSDPAALSTLQRLVHQTKHIYFSYALPETCQTELFEQLAGLILGIASETGAHFSEKAFEVAS